MDDDRRDYRPPDRMSNPLRYCNSSLEVMRVVVMTTYVRYPLSLRSSPMGFGHIRRR
jgi:hypothetical protein